MQRGRRLQHSPPRPTFSAAPNPGPSLPAPGRVAHPSLAPVRPLGATGNSGRHLRAPSLIQVPTRLGYFKRKGTRRGGRPPGSALSEGGRCQEREEQKRARGLGLSIIPDREWPRSSLLPSGRHTRSNKSREERQMRAPLSPPPLHRTYNPSWCLGISR